jgi:hypothetical protein
MHSIDISPFSRGDTDATFTMAETVWIARILWASQ